MQLKAKPHPSGKFAACLAFLVKSRFVINEAVLALPLNMGSFQASTHKDEIILRQTILQPMAHGHWTIGHCLVRFSNTLAIGPRLTSSDTENLTLVWRRFPDHMYWQPNLGQTQLYEKQAEKEICGDLSEPTFLAPWLNLWACHVFRWRDKISVVGPGLHKI